MRYVLMQFFIFFISAFGWGQDYNYVHYNAKDGLAGSTVYDMCQDKDGFMWFATENGLSRFDGKSFANFTVKEGLPDNEVLTIFPDSKGRVWIACFSKELCYYFNGKIYNRKNDSLLSKITWKNHISEFREDKNGVIYFSDQFNLFCLTVKDEWQDYTQFPSFKSLSYSRLNLSAFYKNQHLIIRLDDSLYLLNGIDLVPFSKNEGPETKAGFKLNVFPGSPDIFLPSSNSLLRLTIVEGHSMYVSTSNGAWAIDTVRKSLGNYYLPNKVVSYVFKDKESVTWFSTIGDGIYKLPSEEARTIKQFDLKTPRSSEVFSIIPYKEEIYSGLGFSAVGILKGLKYISLIDVGKQALASQNNLSSNRLYTSFVFDEKNVFLGFDAFLAKMTAGKISYSSLVAIKSIDKYDEQHITVGNHTGLYKVRVGDLAVVDTLWRSRVTKSIAMGTSTFVGTTNGLYLVDQNKRPTFLGSIHPALSRRVSGLCLIDSVLWVATSDQGVVGLKNKRIVADYTMLNGLSSEICKAIFAHGQTLWVGTDKGINKIDVSASKKRIVKYGILDGLPSDIINSIFVDDSLVYVGTPAGLTYFNEQKIERNSICNLQMLGVDLDSSVQLIEGKYALPYQKNSIRFRFTAISFRSAGEIVYHYRLKGLDDSWKLTKENQLNFPALPSGDYVFELYAINKFGVRSEYKKVSFSVATPFWKSPLFFVLGSITIILFTVWVVNKKNSIEKEKLQQENEVQKKLASLEQQALQAQMNPHFIFNCLNSIQHFFLANDGQKANRYLSLFATLVRETLYFSGRQTIKVSEEVQYLKQYLEMEQMRFGEKFQYKVEVDPSVETDFIEVPALLLQPYIENAIRHGIRHKLEGVGQLLLTFKVEDEVLYCKVIDNGIGREKSEEIKGRQHIEYQSKGMDLGQKRIDLWNGLYPNKQIQLEVNDLKDDAGNALGTEVVIKLSIKNVE